jgi:Methyltransferase domain
MGLVCLLCESKDLSPHYQSPKSELFWFCGTCHFVFREPKQWLSKKAEAERYLTHQNYVESKGYQNFLMPVVNSIESHQDPKDLGLDYGCGPQSVIQYLLNQKGFSMDIWDPQFHPLPRPQVKAYDYVSCTEVVEHFQDPINEFTKILSLMKSHGHLYIKTAWVDQVKDFSKWHYQRDPTHVGFFGKKSFAYLSQKLNLEIVKFEEPCAVFRAP